CSTCTFPALASSGTIAFCDCQVDGLCRVRKGLTYTLRSLFALVGGCRLANIPVRRLAFSAPQRLLAGLPAMAADLAFQLEHLDFGFLDSHFVNHFILRCTLVK